METTTARDRSRAVVVGDGSPEDQLVVFLRVTATP